MRKPSLLLINSRDDLLAELHDWMRRTEDPLLQGPLSSRYYENVMATLVRHAAG